MTGLGATIRRLRLSSDMSLQKLSRKTGLSAPQLSKIENDKVDPSVASLRRIADALGVSMSLLVSSDETSRQIDPVAKGGGFLFRRFTGDGDMVLEQFLHVRRNARMQPQLMTFPPGSTSGMPLTHEGDEFFYVLKGQLLFVYGDDQKHTVSEGESLYFDSSVPHRWENPSRADEAVILLVSCPPTF